MRNKLPVERILPDIPKDEQIKAKITCGVKLILKEEVLAQIILRKD
jgi:hypothetical protein